MTKILLFGKHGQIGSQLTNLLDLHCLVSLGRSDVDILDYPKTERIVSDFRPDVIINAVAYNDVDKAEKNPAICMRTNADANSFLSNVSVQYDAFYITFSSDFVFDGQTHTPYLETDRPNPINQYGKSKLQGDMAVQKNSDKYLILRTSSVYSLSHLCFLTKIMKQSKEKKEIFVRDDLFSSPTSAQFIAKTITTIIERCYSKMNMEKNYGLYNLCSSGCVSRYEWARKIKQILNLDINVIPIYQTNTNEYAPRPKYSALNNSLFQNIFDIKIPNWEDMLAKTLENA